MNVMRDSRQVTLVTGPKPVLSVSLDASCKETQIPEAGDAFESIRIRAETVTSLLEGILDLHPAKPPEVRAPTHN
jgi:hypothetical protein